MNRAAWFALLGSGALAGSTFALSAANARQAPPDARPRFVPPVQPVVLTRTLVRDLADGKHIVTRRSWQLTFRTTADGYLVDGALIDSQVEAPPALAALARIEQLRPDGGLFPLPLDAAGLIVAPSPGTSAAVDTARTAAEQSISRSALAPAERGQAQSLLVAVALAAQRSAATWPADLFVPGNRHREDRREIDTGVGGAGWVTVTVDAQSQPGDGLPRLTARQVVTEIGGNRRVSAEQWAIAQRTPDRAR